MDPDLDKAEKKWNEDYPKFYNSFIKENIGYKDVKQLIPKCYKSGDQRSFCLSCSLKSSC